MADPVTLTLASSIIAGGLGTAISSMGNKGAGAPQSTPDAPPTAPPAAPSLINQPLSSPSGTKSATGAANTPSFVGATAIPQQSALGTKTLTGQ